MALIEMDSIDFSYGSVQVLFGVTFHVEQGEMIAILGTNGAGKSTLLRTLSGLAAPSRGTIRLDGVDVTRSGVVAMVGRGVVLVPGGKAVFPDMTVAENLKVAGHTLRSEPSVFAERRARVLELFPGLTERWRSLAGTLSGGEQQQLALGKALILTPRVLCVDELSLGLAPVVVETLLLAVRDINANGTTIVLVEQSLNVAASLCERAVFMEKGEVRFEGATADLLARSDIARAVFLGGHVDGMLTR